MNRLRLPKSPVRNDLADINRGRQSRVRTVIHRKALEKSFSGAENCWRKTLRRSSISGAVRRAPKSKHFLERKYIFSWRLPSTSKGRSPPE